MSGDNMAEEMCECGMPGCKRTLKQAEEEYRSGIIISACALQWPLLYRLHRIMKKLQKRYTNFDAAEASGDSLWEDYRETYGSIQMKVDEELWKIEEYKKKHGRYAGMERGVYKGVGTEGTKIV